MGVPQLTPWPARRRRHRAAGHGGHRGYRGQAPCHFPRTCALFVRLGQSSLASGDLNAVDAFAIHVRRLVSLESDWSGRKEAKAATTCREWIRIWQLAAIIK
jgi:hypothetical protein